MEMASNHLLVSPVISTAQRGPGVGRAGFLSGFGNFFPVSVIFYHPIW